VAARRGRRWMPGCFRRVWSADDGGPLARVTMTLPVTLHIYDLDRAVTGLNALGRAVGTGVFHAGVEVAGKEWSYGAVCAGRHKTGVFVSEPRSCQTFVYRESVPMGEVTTSKEGVDRLVFRLMPEWRGPDYDLLRRNCCHFCGEFCKELGVGPVPRWLTSLADVGAVLRTNLHWALDLWQVLPCDGKGAEDKIVEYTEDEGSSEKERGGKGNEEPRDSAGVLSVGDWVEVFSKSQNAWCLGLVTWRESDDVNVVFQLPGAKSEQWVEKRLPPGCGELRRMGAAPPAECQPAPSWSAEEGAAYKRHFWRLGSYSLKWFGTVDAQAVLQHLRRSGLPKKVLREVWQVANPRNLSKVGITEFSACCRLIGHCQGLLNNSDCAPASRSAPS